MYAFTVYLEEGDTSRASDGISKKIRAVELYLDSDLIDRESIQAMLKNKTEIKDDDKAVFISEFIIPNLERLIVTSVTDHDVIPDNIERVSDVQYLGSTNAVFTVPGSEWSHATKQIKLR
jgi:hypothetical protein